MFWGAEPVLGILSVIGYFVFVTGATLLWTHRSDVSAWTHDELGALRRHFVRYAVAGGGPGLREEARFKLLPSGFLRRVGRLPRRQINRGAILLAVGFLLLLLDFLL